MAGTGMAKAAAPPEYSVSFNRHGKRWGWKRLYPQDDGLPNEQWGWKRRKDANAAAMDAKATEMAKRAADASAKSETEQSP